MYTVPERRVRPSTAPSYRIPSSSVRPAAEERGRKGVPPALHIPEVKIPQKYEASPFQKYRRSRRKPNSPAPNERDSLSQSIDESGSICSGLESALSIKPLTTPTVAVAGASIRMTSQVSVSIVDVNTEKEKEREEEKCLSDDIDYERDTTSPSLCADYSPALQRVSLPTPGTEPGVPSACAHTSSALSPSNERNAPHKQVFETPSFQSAMSVKNRVTRRRPHSAAFRRLPPSMTVPQQAAATCNHLSSNNESLSSKGEGYMIHGQPMTNFTSPSCSSPSPTSMRTGITAERRKVSPVRTQPPLFYATGSSTADQGEECAIAEDYDSKRNKDVFLTTCKASNRRSVSAAMKGTVASKGGTTREVFAQVYNSVHMHHNRVTPFDLARQREAAESAIGRTYARPSSCVPRIVQAREKAIVSNDDHESLHHHGLTHKKNTAMLGSVSMEGIKFGMSKALDAHRSLPVETSGEKALAFAKGLKNFVANAKKMSRVASSDIRS